MQTIKLHTYEQNEDLLVTNYYDLLVLQLH